MILATSDVQPSKSMEAVVTPNPPTYLATVSPMMPESTEQIGDIGFAIVFCAVSTKKLSHVIMPHVHGCLPSKSIQSSTLGLYDRTRSWTNTTPKPQPTSPLSTPINPNIGSSASQGHGPADVV